MKDRDFLKWIHERLEHVHHESPLMDYMHKLRAIIATTDPEKETTNTGMSNSLAELDREGKLKELESWKDSTEPVYIVK
jgi:proline racemase